MKKCNSTLKGKKINLEVKDSLPYLCSRQFSQTLNLSQMLHSTQQRKKAQMASALFNDVQLLGSALTCTAEWDDLPCDEQMRLEDLINTAQ
jgi:hypothetical protein